MTTTTEFFFRRCNHVFSLNNQLHKDIRFIKFVKTQLATANRMIKSETYLNNIVAINNDSIALISFKIDLNKNIEIEYNFKD